MCLPKSEQGLPGVGLFEENDMEFGSHGRQTEMREI